MVAYSFQARFVEPILASTKGGTIRAQRRGSGLARPGGHARPGEPLQLYTGIRTKQCRLITRLYCAEVEPITLNFRSNSVALGAPLLGGTGRMLGFGRSYGPGPQRLDLFAKFDGFDGWDEMSSFFQGKEFSGWHIRWLPLPETLRA